MKKQPSSLRKTLQTIFRNRLLIPYITASLLMMAIAAFYGGKLAEARQMEYAQSIGVSISQFLSHAGHELDALAALSANSSTAALEKSMSATQRSLGSFNTIYFLNQQKKIKTLVPFDSRYVGLDMSRRSYFSSLNCNQGIDFYVQSASIRTGRPTAYLARCAQNGQFLVGELDFFALRALIADANKSSGQMIYVVDHSGNLLAHPNFELVEQQVNIANLPIVQNGIKNNTNMVYWREGGLWIGSTNKIDSAGLVVITEVPLLSAYAPYLAAIMLLTLFFILIFSFAVRDFLLQLDKKLMTPLAYLGRSVEAMSTGNYNPTEVRNETTVPFAEINSLLANFRNMRRIIYNRETELRESERQYRQLIEFSPDAILLHSLSVIFYANHSAVLLYGAKDSSEFIGKSLAELVHPNFHAMLSARMQKIEGKEQTLDLVEQTHIRFDGSEFNAEVITSSVFLSGKHVAQTIVRDITRRKTEEEMLKYRATHDPLTDLPNRFLLKDRLTQAVEHCKRSQTIGAVLYLDLDNFKSINDAFGHAVGDQALQRAAEIMQSALRKGDTIARLSGDEFVILLDPISDLLDAEKVANHIIRALSRPFIIESHEIMLSSSVGIALFPSDGSDPDSLLQSADAAMYSAKQEGKYRAKFYAPHMRAHSLERVTLQKALVHALDENQFFLLYQPQVNALTGDLIGVEALLRWKHPSLGMISPAKFIPIAEETGLIVPIGEWVIKTAWQQALKWQSLNAHPLRVAVNLSNLQFIQAQTISLIESLVSQSQTPADLLEVELTENIVFRDEDNSFNNLFRLRETGVKLAMDDFGAGFSTLGHLAHLPFDRIKIDQRLVAGIQNPKDAAVVSGIITICNNLNLEALAEGVETQQQLDFCASRGCHLFQGWYYSKAVEADEISRYLQGHLPWKNKNQIG